MLHAGLARAGAAESSTAEGVRALRELGADGPLERGDRPGAGPCCYEVGEEVHAAFAGYGAGGPRRGATST